MGHVFMLGRNGGGVHNAGGTAAVPDGVTRAAFGLVREPDAQC